MADLQWLKEIYEDAECFNNLGIAQTEMQYIGFSANHLSGVLRAMQKAHNIDEANFRKYMLTLGLIGCIRGSKLDTIINRSGDVMKEYLTTAKNLFQIEEGKPKTRDSVTLPRIGILMAQTISRGLHSGEIKVPFAITASDVCEDYPKGMCVSTFGALIPRPEEGVLSEPDSDLIFSAFCYHQAIFDRLINSKKNKFTPKEVLGNYARIQYASNMVSNDDRVQHCLTLGILKASSAEGSYVIAEKARKGLELAAQGWRELR